MDYAKHYIIARFNDFIFYFNPAVKIWYERSHIEDLSAYEAITPDLPHIVAEATKYWAPSEEVEIILIDESDLEAV